MYSTYRTVPEAVQLYRYMNRLLDLVPSTGTVCRPCVGSYYMYGRIAVVRKVELVLVTRITNAETSSGAAYTVLQYYTVQYR